MSAPARRAIAEPRRTTSPEATEALGRALAASLAIGDLVGLNGPLGAGKTRFVAGVARGLGVASRVRSPSFTLVNEYSGRIALLHLDLYRLEPFAVDGLGLEELIGRGAVVVEWSDRLPAVWLEEALEIDIDYADGNGRAIQARAGAGRGLALLAAWRALPDAAGSAA